MECDVKELVLGLARLGSKHPLHPEIHRIESFAHFFGQDQGLDQSALDRRDGACTRRELVLRFLVLNAVLDQGPDIAGVRQLLQDVTNELYRKEVRFLHQPAQFFGELGIAIDEILDKHKSIKQLRAEAWAQENQSSATRYNLFMDNSRQALNYAVFRWGVPLALALLLERDEHDESRKHNVLERHLGSFPSAEKMSWGLKDHERYGLGKAIGDKACHLFAKWAVSSFRLLSGGGPNWGGLSFESPFDSNAGRVLWRTGFFLKWAEEKTYQANSVLQPGKGKGGLTHLRVTSIRGMKTVVPLGEEVGQAYKVVCCEHLCSHSRRPRSVEIQRILNAYLCAYGKGLGIAEFDDGLIYVGTNYCFNHGDPDCPECPLRGMCVGAKENRHLIDDYRT